MLSMSEIDGLSDITRQRVYSYRRPYWLPAPSYGPLLPGYDAFDEWAEISTYDSKPWNSDVVHPTIPTCTNCVQYKGGVELQVLQSFDLFFFPFDRQTIRWRFTVPQADLYTCAGDGADALASMGIGKTEWEATQALMPRNRVEWVVDGPFKNAVRVKYGVTTVGGNTTIDKSTCVVSVKIKRVWSVFFVKSMVITMLVAIGALLALYMHPGEMTGDRMAHLFVGILIFVVNLQTDLGLGKLTNLMWIDVFNLVQITLLICAVVEGLVVHHYFATQRENFAIHLDHVFRFVFPFIVYPWVTSACIIWGAYHEDALVIFVMMLTLGIPLLCLVMAGMIRRKSRARDRLIAKCITQCQKYTDNDAEYEPAMFRLFRAVDLDGSGELDSKELRELFRALYPKASRKSIAAAVHMTRPYCNAAGDLDDDSFVDALNAVTDKMAPELRGPEDEDQQENETFFESIVQASGLENVKKDVNDIEKATRKTIRAATKQLASGLGLTGVRSVKKLERTNSDFGALGAKKKSLELTNDSPPGTTGITRSQSLSTSTKSQPASGNPFTLNASGAKATAACSNVHPATGEYLEASAGTMPDLEETEAQRHQEVAGWW